MYLSIQAFLCFLFVSLFLLHFWSSVESPHVWSLSRELRVQSQAELLEAGALPPLPPGLRSRVLPPASQRSSPISAAIYGNPLSSQRAVTSRPPTSRCRDDTRRAYVLPAIITMTPATEGGAGGASDALILARCFVTGQCDAPRGGCNRRAGAHAFIQRVSCRASRSRPEQVAPQRRRIMALSARRAVTRGVFIGVALCTRSKQFAVSLGNKV